MLFSDIFIILILIIFIGGANGYGYGGEVWVRGGLSRDRGIVVGLFNNIRFEDGMGTGSIRNDKSTGEKELVSVQLCGGAGANEFKITTREDVSRSDWRAKTEVHWYTAQGQSWESYREICQSKGADLCKYDEICPSGRWSSPAVTSGSDILPAQINGDRWSPILGEGNTADTLMNWIQSGTPNNDGHAKCTKLSYHHPANKQRCGWCNDRAHHGHKQQFACCSFRKKQHKKASHPCPSQASEFWVQGVKSETDGYEILDVKAGTGTVAGAANTEIIAKTFRARKLQLITRYGVRDYSDFVNDELPLGSSILPTLENWEAAKEKCEAEGQALCKFDDVCPFGEGKPAIDGRLDAEDRLKEHSWTRSYGTQPVWIPAGDSENQWISAGEYPADTAQGKRLCTKDNGWLSGWNPPGNKKQSKYEIMCCRGKTSSEKRVNPRKYPICSELANLKYTWADVSTNQPARSSSSHDSDGGTEAANDGNFNRQHHNQWHVKNGNNADNWWGVQLSQPSSDFRITFYARDCCNVGNMNGKAAIWMANDWPDHNTKWSDWAKRSDAVHCNDFAVVDNGITSIQCLDLTSTYSYIFVRPASSGGSTIQIPEITVMADLKIDGTSYSTSMRSCFSPDNYQIYEGQWKWKSTHGGYMATKTGTPQLKEDKKGTFGAAVNQPYLHGKTSDTFSFGQIKKSASGNGGTLCSKTRYTGTTRGRILSGGYNWLHGHHSGHWGVFHYNGWAYTGGGSHNTNLGGRNHWVSTCVHSNLYHMNINGVQYQGTLNTNNPDTNVYINGGGCCGGEKSDFGIAFLASWNRRLDPVEMKYVVDYMMYGIATPLQPYIFQPTRIGFHSDFGTELGFIRGADLKVSTKSTGSSSSCTMCDGDFWCARNQQFPNITFTDPLRSDPNDPSAMREIETMKVRFFGSMALNAEVHDSRDGGAGYDKTNTAAAYFNGKVMQENVIGVGTAGDMMCGECHGTSTLEVGMGHSSMASYQYSETGVVNRTNIISLKPAAEKAWCVAKVEITMCSKAGPPVIRNLERADGGSLKHLSPGGGDRIIIYGANLGETVLLGGVTYGPLPSHTAVFAAVNCTKPEFPYSTLTCTTVAGIGKGHLWVVTANGRMSYDVSSDDGPFQHCRGTCNTSYAAPEIISITPQFVSPTGGDTIKIRGRYLLRPATIPFTSFESKILVTIPDIEPSYRTDAMTTTRCDDSPAECWGRPVNMLEPDDDAEIIYVDEDDHSIQEIEFVVPQLGSECQRNGASRAVDIEQYFFHEEVGQLYPPSSSLDTAASGQYSVAKPFIIGATVTYKQNFEDIIVGISGNNLGSPLCPGSVQVRCTGRPTWWPGSIGSATHDGSQTSVSSTGHGFSSGSQIVIDGEAVTVSSVNGDVFIYNGAPLKNGYVKITTLETAHSVSRYVAPPQLKYCHDNQTTIIRPKMLCTSLEQCEQNLEPTECPATCAQCLQQYTTHHPENTFAKRMSILFSLGDGDIFPCWVKFSLGESLGSDYTSTEVRLIGRSPTLVGQKCGGFPTDVALSCDVSIEVDTTTCTDIQGCKIVNEDEPLSNGEHELTDTATWMKTDGTSPPFKLKVKFIYVSAQKEIAVRLDERENNGEIKSQYFAVNEPLPACCNHPSVPCAADKPSGYCTPMLQYSDGVYIKHLGTDALLHPYELNVRMPEGQGKDLDFVISLSGQDSALSPDTAAVKVSYIPPTITSVHLRNAATIETIISTVSEGSMNQSTTETVTRRVPAKYVGTDGKTVLEMEGDNFGMESHNQVYLLLADKEIPKSVSGLKYDPTSINLVWISHQLVRFRVPPGEGTDPFRFRLHAGNQKNCDDYSTCDSFEVQYAKPEIDRWDVAPDAATGCPTVDHNCPTEGNFQVKVHGVNFGTPSADVEIQFHTASSTFQFKCEIVAWGQTWISCTVPSGGGGPYYPIVVVSGQTSELNSLVSFKYSPPIIDEVFLCSQGSGVESLCDSSVGLTQIPTTSDWNHFLPETCDGSTTTTDANHNPVYILVTGKNFGPSPRLKICSTCTPTQNSQEKEASHQIISANIWTEYLAESNRVHKMLKFRVCPGEGTNIKFSVQTDVSSTEFTDDVSYSYAAPSVTRISFPAANAPLLFPKLRVPTTGCARVIRMVDDVFNVETCKDSPAYFELHGLNFGISAPIVTVRSISTQISVGELGGKKPWFDPVTGSAIEQECLIIDGHYDHKYIRVRLPVGHGKVEIAVVAQKDRDAPGGISFAYSDPVILGVKWGISLPAAVVDGYYDAFGSRSKNGKVGKLFLLGENFGEYNSPVSISLRGENCTEATWHAPSTTSEGRPYLSCKVKPSKVGKQKLTMSVAASIRSIINKEDRGAPSARCFEGYSGLDGEYCVECRHWDDEVYDRRTYAALCTGFYLAESPVPRKNSSSFQIDPLLTTGGTEEPISKKGYAMGPPPECLGGKCSIPEGSKSVYADIVPDRCVDFVDESGVFIEQAMTNSFLEVDDSEFENLEEEESKKGENGEICAEALMPGKWCHPTRKNGIRKICTYIEVCQPSSSCLANNTCNVLEGYISYYDAYNNDGSCVKGHLKLPASALEAGVSYESANWGKCFAPRCTMCAVPTHFRLEGECVACPSIPWLLPQQKT